MNSFGIASALKIQQQKNFKNGEIELRPYDIVCFCTGLTNAKLKSMYEENPKITVSEIALKTQASYHCGGCKKSLTKKLDELNAKEGKFAGMSKKPERSYLDQSGKFNKYLGEYPHFWIIKILQLQKDWMIQEDFVEKFHFEIVDAPVPYIDFVLQGEVDIKKAQIYFEHFGQYVEGKTKAKWYFSLS